MYVVIFSTLFSRKIMVYIAVKNFMTLRQVVPVLHDLVVFYKMADCCRPEVASDTISGQKVGVIEAYNLTKFHDPSSHCLRVIKFTHSVKAMMAMAYASHRMNAPRWLARTLKIVTLRNQMKNNIYPVSS